MNDLDHSICEEHDEHDNMKQAHLSVHHIKSF